MKIDSTNSTKNEKIKETIAPSNQVDCVFLYVSQKAVTKYVKNIINNSSTNINIIFLIRKFLIIRSIFFLFPSFLFH